MLEGALSAPILFISDHQRVSCRAEGKPMGQALFRSLDSALKRVGLGSSDAWAMTILSAGWQDIVRSSQANVLVPLGSQALEAITGLQSIEKWHCNVVSATAEFGLRKCVPIYHPEHCQRVYSDGAYIQFGMQKVKAELEHSDIRIPARNFVLGPDYRDSMAYLDALLQEPVDPVALDIETGGGLINTVGFATSATEAVAIKTLPEFYSPSEYLSLWQAIARVLEGPRPKILQNFIYELTWFSRYGIRMERTAWDTMWAMKFIYPEFEKGLHNVGRLFTPFPYWKDDNDDWSRVRDWPRHLDYNCKDTTGTYAAWTGQRRALATRGLLELFEGFVLRFMEPIAEMCCTGLRVDEQALSGLRAKLLDELANYTRIIDQECLSAIGRTINPRSSQQVKAALQAMGLKIPMQKGKLSTDKKALVKLRKKHPDAAILQALLGLSKANKQLSSYVDFDYDRTKARVHYQLDGNSTETGRWSGHLSGWGEGFNPQTVPKSVRKCFVADPGSTLLQVDLSQAESRYVAYESPEPKLMEMLARGEDVHAYVAGAIYNKHPSMVSKPERQLGKKSGHSANYGVGPRTFVEACLVEMNLVLQEREAARIIQTYFQVFPGIRQRQANIRKLIFEKRELITPIGRKRYFYGRPNDATFREAYAYCPQSTIPDITNHLMLRLWEEREYLGIEQFLLQVHDSLLLQVDPDRVQDVAAFCRDLSTWHPKISLPGGDLLIPVDVEVGDRWGSMEKLS